MIVVQQNLKIILYLNSRKVNYCTIILFSFMIKEEFPS